MHHRPLPYSASCEPFASRQPTGTSCRKAVAFRVTASERDSHSRPSNNSHVQTLHHDRRVTRQATSPEGATCSRAKVVNWMFQEHPIHNQIKLGRLGNTVAK